MGGSIERIKILPIGLSSEEEVKNMFENVSAQNCKCHLGKDTEIQKLQYN